MKIGLCHMRRQRRTHTVGCKVKESEYTQIESIAERSGKQAGEWCREVILDAIQNASTPVSSFERILLEELAALRGIVSSVMYDLTTGSSMSVERMKQIIAHADQTKFERAARTIDQLPKRQSVTPNE
jgi:hypothetical protein